MDAFRILNGIMLIRGFSFVPSSPGDLAVSRGDIWVNVLSQNGVQLENDIHMCNPQASTHD